MALTPITVGPAPLPRSELASFLKNPRQIDAFERMQDGSTQQIEQINLLIDQVTAILAAPLLSWDDSSEFGADKVLEPGFGLVLTLGPDQATLDVSLNSDQVPEGGTNLYFTNSRARTALTGGVGINYNSASGVIALALTTAVGSYTPTVSAASNTDSLPTVNAPFDWERMGDHVVGSGFLTVDPTVAGLVGISLSLCQRAPKIPQKWASKIP